MINLKPGDQAPDFSGTDQKGKKVSLSDFRGRKVIVYFYPQDDTPTCTTEACNLRDHHAQLKRAGFVVLGISPDNEKSHKKFAGKYDLPFTLIADPENKIINQYDVWGQKQLFGREYMGVLRTTFLIDENGIIRHVFEKPKSSEHAEEILAWAKENGMLR
jgi:peroxiredoxin Q/BCP